MSELAPDFAPPSADKAKSGVVAPVPPDAMGKAFVSAKLVSASAAVQVALVPSVVKTLPPFPG